VEGAVAVENFVAAEAAVEWMPSVAAEAAAVATEAAVVAAVVAAVAAEAEGAAGTNSPVPNSARQEARGNA